MREKLLEKAPAISQIEISWLEGVGFTHTPPTASSTCLSRSQSSLSSPPPRRPHRTPLLRCVQKTQMAEARATKPAPKLADVLRSAGKKALDGGIAGALAMVLQMFALISCADHSAVDAHDDQSTTSTSTGRRRARRWPICSQSFGIEALDCTRMAASAASTPGSVWRCCRRRCHGSRFGSRASVTR